MAEASESSVWPYVLLAPALALVLALTIAPLLWGTVASFMTLVLNKPSRGSGFAGLDNYRALIDDRSFADVLGNTVVWVATLVVAEFIVGFAVALSLARPSRSGGAIGAAIFLPWAMPAVLVGLIWSWIFDARAGLLNDLLMRVGVLEVPVPWLARPDTAMPAAMVAAIWKGFPFFAILLLAGLRSIPAELFEAAAVDGASRLQAFRAVTLPIMLPLIALTTLLRIIWTFNAAELIFAMTGGGPANSTQILATYAFTTAYVEFDFGKAAALGVLMMVLLSVLTIFYVRVSGVLRT